MSSDSNDLQQVYVSITGLKLKSFVYFPVFMWHAVRSMKQVHKAQGIVSAEARKINGVHHTVSVWKSRKDMLAYMTRGSHAKAMAAFPKIATGKVFGMTMDKIPKWEEVPDLWNKYGGEVSPSKKK